MKRSLTHSTFLAASLLALAAPAALAQEKAAPAAPAATAITWTAPDIDKLPDDAYGRLARYGKELATETYKHIGPEVADKSKRYAGNNFACASCHLDAGTKPFAMPWVGVHASFPQYRGRENEISTMEERVNGCMERSMAGKPLPLDSREMKAFLTYFHFLSTGMPVAGKIEGQGTKRFALMKRAADPVAGKAVYDEQCASCHGANGEGQRKGEPGDAGGYTYPALWGADSYNMGAGMYRVITAAQFIRYNMPLGATHDAPVLSEEQAYDVAAYINSQPRMVKTNLERDFPAKFNKPVDAAFAPYYDDFPANQHKYGPWQPLLEAQKKIAPAK